MHLSDVSQGEAGLCEGTSELQISGLQEEVGTTHQPDGFHSLGDAIRFQATSQPNQSAILSSAFAPLSYRQLQQQIEGIGSQLRQIGFRREARIGIALPDGPEAVLAIVAVSCCAIAVPFDPKLTPAEIDQRLGILRLDAIILGEASNSSVRSVAERRGVGIVEAFSVGGGELGLTLDAPAGDFPAPPERPDSSAVAFILQTSGTTALPKLIPFSHGNMLAAAKRLQTWFTLTALDRCLSVSPPYYSHGLKVTVFTPLLTGGAWRFRAAGRRSISSNGSRSCAPPGIPQVQPSTALYSMRHGPTQAAGPCIHCASPCRAAPIAAGSARRAAGYPIDSRPRALWLQRGGTNCRQSTPSWPEQTGNMRQAVARHPCRCRRGRASNAPRRARGDPGWRTHLDVRLPG